MIGSSPITALDLPSVELNILWLVVVLLLTQMPALIFGLIAVFSRRKERRSNALTVLSLLRRKAAVAETHLPENLSGQANEL